MAKLTGVEPGTRLRRVPEEVWEARRNRGAKRPRIRIGPGLLRPRIKRLMAPPPTPSMGTRKKPVKSVAKKTGIRKPRLDLKVKDSWPMKRNPTPAMLRFMQGDAICPPGYIRRLGDVRCRMFKDSRNKKKRFCPNGFRNPLTNRCMRIDLPYGGAMYSRMLGRKELGFSAKKIACSQGGKKGYWWYRPGVPHATCINNERLRTWATAWRAQGRPTKFKK